MKRAKTTNPNQDVQSSSYNVVKETLKFNSMLPLESETLVAFHERLTTQAALCGFQCRDCRGSYKQRLIRDRLLQVLDVYLRSMIFERNEDPSVDDILAVYQEDLNLQSHPGWTNILSYLELVELETFAKSHKPFRKIVNSFLKNGGKLVIKGRSMNRFRDSRDMFTVYGQRTTVLELADIEGNDIFTHFPLVNDLTLVNVLLKIDESHKFPRSLKKLHLTCHKSTLSCEVEMILAKSRPSLEHLFISMQEVNRVPCLGGFTFPKLKTLTLVDTPLDIGVNHQLFSPVLEVFHMEISKYPVIFDGYSGFPSSSWEPFHGLPLTSSTLHDWNENGESERFKMVKSWTKLKHLRILKPISPAAMNRIMALNLESVDVHFLDVPEDQDLMVNMLVDDCIHLIMDFLSVEDLIALCQVHSRFGKVVATRPKMEFRFDKDVLERYPVMENRAFYYWCGRIVNQLKFRCHDEDTFYEVIGHFKMLENLSLKYISFHDNGQFWKFPKELSCMELVNVSLSDSISNSTISELFKKLNQTLVELRVYGLRAKAVIENLSELTNIRDLSLGKVEITPKWIQFLVQNQKNMTRLQLLDLESGDIPQLQQVVRQMKNLKYLIMRGDYALPSHASLPELEELHISNHDTVLAQTLTGLDAPKLKLLGLKVTENKKEFGKVVRDSVPQIEKWELGVVMSVITADTLVQEILLGPTELKALTVHDHFEISGDNVLALVRGLPRLGNLQAKLHFNVLDWDVLKALREYLPENNRSLKLNKMIL